MDFEKLNPAYTVSLPSQATAITVISRESLSYISEKAFDRLSFTFSRTHLEHLASIACNEENSANDRMVASLLLENAVISAKGTFPLCQDTGTAQIFAWKEGGIATMGDDTTDLSRGAEKTYRERNLRFSTTIPTNLFDETDPGTNMPAQVLIQAGSNATPARLPAYRFLFCAKGGGSSNKTSLTQATKAILNETAFTAFLKTKIAELGTAACPPYSISVVVGGISPEQNLLALKLATAGFFDTDIDGQDYRVFGTIPLRAPDWEQKILDMASDTGLGAQFGGKALAVSACVLRLPRHGASCPVSIGVSCSAHRNLYGYIDASGIYLEKTVSDPLSVPGVREGIQCAKSASGASIHVNLDEGIDAVRNVLSGLEPGTPVLLSGRLLVARDAAHAKWKALLGAGKELPAYTLKYPIIYAGPAGTPPGAASGSFGPTTAGRMDEYADDLMSRGASLVTLAKGNRSEKWRKACERFGGTYLGTVGGAAALIAEKHIEESQLIDYPELGMEAVRLVTVRNLPAFILVNDRGEDFYRNIMEAHS